MEFYKHWQITSVLPQLMSLCPSRKVTGYNTQGKHIIIFFQTYKVNPKKDPNCRRDTSRSTTWMAVQEENRIKINSYTRVLAPKWNQQQCLETLIIVQFHWLLQKSHRNLIEK